MQFWVISPGDWVFTALIIGLCSSNSHWSYVRGYTHQHMTIDWEKVVYHYLFSCLSRKVQLTPFCHPWIPGSYKSGVSSILEWSILVKHGLVGVFEFPLAYLCQWHMLADSIHRFTTFWLLTPSLVDSRNSLFSAVFLLTWPSWGSQKALLLQSLANCAWIPAHSRDCPYLVAPAQRASDWSCQAPEESQGQMLARWKVSTMEFKHH